MTIHSGIYGLTKKTGWFYLLLIFILFISITCKAQNEFPVLSAVYEVNNEPSDYIVVVDQSGSVRKFWDPIKKSIIQIVDLANEGDYISFIGFQESTDNLMLPRNLTSTNKEATIHEIDKLSEPRGRFTDLFESVDFILEKGINRPNGNQIQLVFYFTDFINEPPPYSSWKNNSTDQLVTKRINYIDKSGKLVNIFAFQLPLEAGAGRDFEEFSLIFDNRVKRIISDLNTMQNWFERLSQEIYREKLKLVMQDDLSNFVEIKTLRAKGNSIEMEIANKMGIPIVINQIDLTSEESRLKTSQLFTDARIPSKETKKLTVPIAEYLEGYKSYLEKTIRIENPVITLHYSFDQLDSELAILNIPNEQVRSINFDKTILAKTGLRYWMAGIIALLIILLGHFIYKTWIKPEWIFKRKSFKVTISLGGTLLQNSSRIIQPTRKTVIIDNTIINQNDIPQFKIYLVPVKPRFLSGHPKRGTYIYAECPAGHLKVRKHEKGKESLTPIPTTKRLFTEQVFLHKGVRISGEFNSGINTTIVDINFLPVS